jgi:hypothetical protein
MIVDPDQNISHSSYVSRYVSTFRLPPCQDSRSEIVIDFPRLRFTSNIMVSPRL